MHVKSVRLATPLTIEAAPLTRDAFAPFGDVIANPRPDATPANSREDIGGLPCGAVLTNQGSAIQYRDIASLRDFYGEAPSAGRSCGTPRMTMFVCAARARVGGSVGVDVLERHPFTSQSFIPLGADRSTRYLVVVAPTAGRSDLPVRDGAGSGLPDLSGLRAFLALGDQAVTYAAGTWHAPMIALGPEGSTVDFVVVQFASGVALEDCQEVGIGLEGEGEGGAVVTVRIPEVVGSV